MVRLRKLMYIFSIVFGLVGLLCFMFSDILNNLHASTFFSEDGLGLYSVQLLAVGVSVASFPLGYCWHMGTGYRIALLSVILLSGVLTIMSGVADYSSTMASEYKSLKQERDTLIERLPFCQRSRTCISQDMDHRISELNNELTEKSLKHNLAENPMYRPIQSFLTFSRAFGIPIIIAFLGSHLSRTRFDNEAGLSPAGPQPVPALYPVPVVPENEEKEVINVGPLTDLEHRRVVNAYKSMLERGEQPSCRKLAREARVANAKVNKEVLKALHNAQSGDNPDWAAIIKTGGSRA